MFPLFFLFTVLPFVELAVLILIGQRIGFWPTLWMTIAAGVVGAVLAKSQGRRVISEWQRALAEGRMPEEGLISALLVLVGAVLLVTPGVLSDVVGFFMLLPPTRRIFAHLLRSWVARRIADGRLRVFTFGDRASPPTSQSPPGQRPFERPTGPIIDMEDPSTR
jgi:UPF0716 protein FxsA